jgi:hypothetical protein
MYPKVPHPRMYKEHVILEWKVQVLNTELLGFTLITWRSEKFDDIVDRYHVEDSKTLPCLKAVRSLISNRSSLPVKVHHSLPMGRHT